uniref:Uncharacterized protein n=1 Tax=Solanum tuberosum TaxID=4113 RepID=M1CLX3_SOLTU
MGTKLSVRSQAVDGSGFFLVIPYFMVTVPSLFSSYILQLKLFFIFILQRIGIFLAIPYFMVMVLSLFTSYVLLAIICHVHFTNLASNKSLVEM